MVSLYTYIIPVDDGAAPNPFHGMCTLAICKPTIRRTAKTGDWIVGLGSKNAPKKRDLSGRMVYAMRVDDKITMQEYDSKAKVNWPHRIPNIKSMELQKRLGDNIYDYSNGAPTQRASVHKKENIETDLNGKYVLISRHFYYFGCNAIKLPKALLTKIIHQEQGHRSKSNEPYVDEFVKWIESSDHSIGQLYGWPDFTIDWKDSSRCGVCSTRKREAENDNPIETSNHAC